MPDNQDIVNLSSMREITDGDPEIEKEMIQEYFNGCDECLATMKETWSNPARSDEWSEAGHAVKGNSLMLGAENLAAMCKHAQLNPDETVEEKKALLDKILAEYEKVCAVLRSLYAL